ncbi:MAG: beta-lactamase family protein, partial [Lachnospiraceae bacterium]|nr:beta-lactamase family protein [Lachnospiraceae bacterium]
MGFFKWIFVLFSTSMITSGVSTDASVSEARGDMLSEMEYSEVATEIDQYTEEHSDALSGMAVSVFDDEGLICDRYYGYADRENAKTVDENTVF